MGKLNVFSKPSECNLECDSDKINLYRSNPSKLKSLKEVLIDLIDSGEIDQLIHFIQVRSNCDESILKENKEVIDLYANEFLESEGFDLIASSFDYVYYSYDNFVISIDTTIDGKHHNNCRNIDEIVKSDSALMVRVAPILMDLGNILVYPGGTPCEFTERFESRLTSVVKGRLPDIKYSVGNLGPNLIMKDSHGITFIIDAGW